MRTNGASTSPSVRRARPAHSSQPVGGEIFRWPVPAVRATAKSLGPPGSGRQREVLPQRRHDPRRRPGWTRLPFFRRHEKYCQNGGRPSPASKSDGPGSKDAMMAPSRGPLKISGLQGKGFTARESTAGTGACPSPPSPRRLGLGSKMADHGPPSAPPRNGRFAGKRLQGSVIRPLGAAMDSSALADARSTARTGAWPSPTITASACQGFSALG
jgi:hypothetical protein